MAESAAAFAEWLAALPVGGIYLVLLAVSFLENVVPPVWGDTLIVLCGWLVGIGTLAFVPTVAIASVGGIAGFAVVYAVGRGLGDAVDDPSRMRWIPRAPLKAARRWLQRWGQGVIVANRFLAGGRSVISLLAGASRMPFGQTMAWASVSATAWCVLLVSAGTYVGAEWERVLDLLAVYGQAVTALLALAALGLGGRWALRRRAGAGGGQETEKSTPPEARGGSAR